MELMICMFQVKSNTIPYIDYSVILLSVNEFLMRKKVFLSIKGDDVAWYNL